VRRAPATASWIRRWWSRWGAWGRVAPCPATPMALRSLSARPVSGCLPVGSGAAHADRSRFPSRWSFRAAGDALPVDEMGGPGEGLEEGAGNPRRRSITGARVNWGNC